MPISIRTMRDIWDSERKKKKHPPPSVRLFPLEIEKHYLDFLARKSAFLKTKEEIAKAFADYESRLGDAGFSKI